MFNNKLKDRRIAVLVADGFEKVEFSVPVNAFRAMGARVDVVSLRKGRIRGVNLHEPAGRVRVKKTIDKANAADYDALYVPGGFINPDLLRQSAAARQFVRAFNDAGKLIASMCHGPWVLVSAGILEGRTIAAWPGIRDDVVNAGATWLDEEVVRDGNLITSRGPQDLAPFIEAVTKVLTVGEFDAPIDEGAPSAPQRDQPPAVMLGALRWIPRPSFRTLAGVGAVLGTSALLGKRNSRTQRFLPIRK